VRHHWLAVALGLCLTTVVASAHHSYADFDNNRPITLRGVVSDFKWENPHVLIFVDVADESGKVVNWEVEGNPPGRIVGKGIKDAVRTGAGVTINAFRAKDPMRNYAQGYDLVVPDGRRFIIGVKLK
jgi:hypothetical protein